MNVIDEIPERLRDPVANALVWVNSEKNSSFDLTGITEFETALHAGPNDTYEIGLVLCDGDICDKVQVRFVQHDGALTFSLVENQLSEIPPLLDPPAGVRAKWLDQVIAKHEFVVLLFYRGLW